MGDEVGANILIVDDHPENLLAMEAILKDLGQNLVMAHSGVEALHRLLDNEFAVILLDVQMPGIDGFETARLIRERERSKHTPLIFLTAIHRTEMHASLGYEAGAVDYLFKPIVPQVLRSKVAVFVDLFRKTEEVKRQAALLRQMEQKDHQRQLDELTDQNRQTREISRIKSEFLAMMSHELRTPLNAIMGFSELLAADEAGPLTAGEQEYLSHVLASSRHLLKLIDNVLDLSQVESGKMRFRDEPLDLAKVIGEVCDILRPLSAPKRIVLKAEVPPDLGRIQLDPARLKQVLFNYLSNAMKFTGDGGRVTLRVSAEGPDWFRVEVSDTGTGIREEDVGRLFLPFEQLQSDASLAGTGLGLAVTRHIVEAQGGHVGVRSSLTQGSTFFAVLPRVMGCPSGTSVTSTWQATGQAAEAMEMSPVPLKDPRPDNGSSSPIVLIVDDNPINLRLAKAVLSGRGYEIMTATRAEEALEILEKTLPTLILTDLGLPGMSGLEMTRRLRADPATQDLIIVALTASAMEGDEQAALEAGCNGYLPKPINIQHLRSKVAAHISGAPTRALTL